MGARPPLRGVSEIRRGRVAPGDPACRRPGRRAWRSRRSRLFFLPALFGIGGDDRRSDRPSPSSSAPVATATPEPTPVPDPTPQVYTIQEGDTLSRIAAEFGLTLEELLAANEETITDPNRIAVGDQIIIPTPPPDEVDGGQSARGAATPEP